MPVAPPAFACPLAYSAVPCAAFLILSWPTFLGLITFCPNFLTAVGILFPNKEAAAIHGAASCTAIIHSCL